MPAMCTQGVTTMRAFGTNELVRPLRGRRRPQVMHHAVNGLNQSIKIDRRLEMQYIIITQSGEPGLFAQCSLGAKLSKMKQWLSDPKSSEKVTMIFTSDIYWRMKKSTNLFHALTSKKPELSRSKSSVYYAVEHT